MTGSPHSGYYECHITLEPEDREKVEPLAKEHGFKVSALVGDEVLGDAKKIYCTAHAKEEMKMRTRMAALTFDLINAKIYIIRRKIEHIIYDERYAKP